MEASFWFAMLAFVIGLKFTHSEPFNSPPVSTKSFPYLQPNIDFYPQELKGVMEGETRLVSFGIIWGNDSAAKGDTFDAPSRGRFETKFRLIISSEDPSILEVVNSSYIHCLEPGETNTNLTFAVKGVFLGYTKVIVSLEHAPDGCFFESLGSVVSRTFVLSVSVIRVPSSLVKIVTGVMAALVAFNYINMGVQLDLACVGKVLKKPIGPVIGFICQFLFMPLASFGFSYLLFDDVSLRLGLFTLGCSPGGSMSNFWTLLFNGDVNLSITMTFISTFAALAMMPLWIFTLGRTLFRDREATIPYFNLAGSLIMLTIPIGVGLLIRQYSPRLTNFSNKIIKPVTILCVLVGIGVGIYANSFIFLLFTWRVVVAGMAVAWGGYTFGALAAWIARLTRPEIVAVSIETAFQNPAVAFVMLLVSLPQPEADLTSVPVIAQLLLTGLPMWLLLIATRLRTAVKNCSADKRKEANKSQLDIPIKDYVALSTNPSKPDDNPPPYLQT